LDFCPRFLKNNGFLLNGLSFSVFQRTYAKRHNKRRQPGFSYFQRGESEKVGNNTESVRGPK
jgi:hypothetical protein